jgi:proteasome lid subunit RPN8/RPN11
MLEAACSFDILFVTQHSQFELETCIAGHFPLEGCGFLLGQHSRGIAWVTHVYTVINTDKCLSSFAISYADEARIYRIAKREALSVLAVFHSHPSGDLTLSKADLVSLQDSPLPWIVCCLTSGHQGELKVVGYTPRTALPIPIRVRSDGVTH